MEKIDSYSVVCLLVFYWFVWSSTCILGVPQYAVANMVLAWLAGLVYVTLDIFSYIQWLFFSNS